MLPHYAPTIMTKATLPIIELKKMYISGYKCTKYQSNLTCNYGLLLLFHYNYIRYTHNIFSICFYCSTSCDKSTEGEFYGIIKNAYIGLFLFVIIVLIERYVVSVGIIHFRLKYYSLNIIIYICSASLVRKTLTRVSNEQKLKDIVL